LPISREKKEDVIADLVERFTRSQAAFLTDYRGLSAWEMTGLRNRLRESSTAYQVVKNTLTKLALAQAKLPVPVELLSGPTAIGFCYKDPVAPAKVMMEYARDNESFSIKGALIGLRVVGPEEVRAIAELPPREVLLGKVVGGLQAPIAGLVNVLGGTLRGLLYVLQARLRELQEEAKN